MCVSYSVLKQGGLTGGEGGGPVTGWQSVAATCILSHSPVHYYRELSECLGLLIG